MTSQPQFTRESVAVGYKVRIEGAEPVKMRYSSVQFRPVMATVEFVDGKLQRLKLAGPNVKKDGSDGQNRHDASYWDGRDMPAWCEQLVEQFRPAAAEAAR